MTFSILKLGRVGLAPILGVSLLGACSLDFATDGVEKQIDDAQDEIDKAVDEAANVEICDGMTFQELMDAQTITEDCKDQLQSYLPEPEDNFQGRLLIAGQTENEDGSLSVFVFGADEDGSALSATELAQLSVTVTLDGEATPLEEDQFEIVANADLTGDLLSVGFVNDYSGSMSDPDLEVTAEIESDLISVLPNIFEGEVTMFSTVVEKRLAFSEDRMKVLAAVAYDSDFTRELTALYDGMGTGLTSLIERERPMRLLVVATDGQENESKTYVKSQLVELLEENNVCVLMLGSLFSDPSELKDLTGTCGVYFYTRGYGELKSTVEAYVESLAALTEVRIPAESWAGAKVELSWGELSAELK